ncbi:hypothetical protein FJT64_010464 [Amphibalanus amphitrite]|uniref:Uncharacterized protein n=1 Tax=Amphibalanus amphitrite TaxID=1232801 RepID=A0A6A4V9Z5_AMPAM|nr:hypothetical protein FJT64_010464 [Amphibalanus amphitrite]
MQLLRVSLALAALLVAAEAVLVVTTTTGTVATGVAVGAAALAGVGGLALGAGLVGAVARGGRRGRGRGRRAADTDELRRQLALDVSAAADPAGCALKLVCLLEAQPEPQRDAEAGALLDLVGEPRLPERVQTPRQAYLYSAYLGSVGGAAACQRQFAACAFGLQDMMDYVRRLSA